MAVSVAAGQSLGFAGEPDNAFIEGCPWAGTSQKPESIQQQRVPGDSTPCGGVQTTPCQSRSGDRADRVKLTSELPESPSTYVPLSRREKFDLFLRITCAPHTFFSAAFAASLAQAEGQWYEYGGGLPGWGKRFGAPARPLSQSGFTLCDLWRLTRIGEQATWNPAPGNRNSQHLEVAVSAQSKASVRMPPGQTCLAR